MEGHGRRGRFMLRRDAAAWRGLVRRLGCVLEAPARHCLPAGEAGMAIADAAAGHRRERDKGESWQGMARIFDSGHVDASWRAWRPPDGVCLAW